MTADARIPNILGRPAVDSTRLDGVSTRLSPPAEIADAPASTHSASGLSHAEPLVDPAHNRRPNVLVAGIGNTWLHDDGFGSEVIRILRERHDPPPPGIHLADFATSGLDLAYEAMRGYDALLLVDASRQGEPPGTLYVMEPGPDDVDGAIEDGQLLDPHGMDPLNVLRFVKYVGGWPGRVVVVACEPQDVTDVGFGLSEPVAGVLTRAADLVMQTATELQEHAAAHA